MKLDNKQGLITFSISLIVFAGIAIAGLFFLKPGNEMGYMLLNYYILMPLLTFVSTLFLAYKNNDSKWIYVFFFGLLGMILPSIVLKASWDWISLFFALVPSLLGLILGSVFYNKRNV